MTVVTRFGLVALMLPLLVATVRAQGELTQPSEIITINASIPRPVGTFEISAALLVLQPGAGSLHYATVVNPFPFASPHWANQEVRPDFTPAFNIGGRFLFAGGGDVQLSWTHFNSYDNASVRAAVPLQLNQMSGPPDVQAINPPYLIGPPVPYATAVGTAHFNYDSVELVAGATLAFGERLQLRPFAGIQVARINESLAGHFQNTDLALGLIDTTTSTFTGAGPRLGLELHYLAGNFDFLGGLAGATLVGTQQSHKSFLAISPPELNSVLPPPPYPNLQSLSAPDVTQVIPCIDAKLAASYSGQFGVGIWKCELGYQASVYINAIKQYALTEVENTLVADGPGRPETIGATVFLRTAAEMQSNFFLHGPYVKFSLQF